MFDLSNFLLSNRWFGFEPVVKNDYVMVDDAFDSKARNAILFFIRHHELSDSERNELLKRKIKEDYPDTADLFSTYCDDVKIGDEVSAQLIDFLLYSMPGELRYLNDDEIADMMNEAYDFLAKGLSDYLADFVNLVREKNDTAYAIGIEMMKYRQDDSNGAYDPSEYLKIMYYLFNQEYIEENNMYKCAAESKKYVDAWLFLSLHFICALRNSDLVRLPHPRLKSAPSVVLEQVTAGTFSDDDAKFTLVSLQTILEYMPRKPNKTKDTQGIGNIKLFVPTSIEVHIGKLLAIAEAHHQLSGLSKDDQLIHNIRTYKAIENAMGEEIGELFLESDFRARKANKSYLQMIYLLTDAVTKENDDFNVKGYMLAALARSHKGSYGSFAQTTATYLKDAKMSGYSPDFVIRELFERGVLSFIPSMLLKMLTDGEYSDLSLSAQTSFIKKLDMSPSEVESTVGLVQSTYKNATEIAEEVYSSFSDKEVLNILHNIGNGNSYSKQNESLCLVTAMHKMCPFKERTSCIGCRYEISTKATFQLMLREYKRNKEIFNTSHSEAEIKRSKAVAEKIIIPSIQRMIICMKNDYGKEASDDLIRLAKEEIE